MNFSYERATKTGETAKVNIKINLLHLIGLIQFCDNIKNLLDGLPF